MGSAGQQLEPLSLATSHQQHPGHQQHQTMVAVNNQMRTFSSFYPPANNGAATLARIRSNPLHQGSSPRDFGSAVIIPNAASSSSAGNSRLINSPHESSPGADFVPLPPAEFCDLPPPPQADVANDSSSSSISTTTPMVVVNEDEYDDEASVSISIMSSSATTATVVPIKTRSSLSKGIRKPPDGSAGASGTVKKVKIVLPPSSIVHESPDEGIVDCGPEGTEV